MARADGPGASAAPGRRRRRGRLRARRDRARRLRVRAGSRVRHQPDDRVAVADGRRHLDRRRGRTASSPPATGCSSARPAGSAPSSTGSTATTPSTSCRWSRSACSRRPRAPSPAGSRCCCAGPRPRSPIAGRVTRSPPCSTTPSCRPWPSSSGAPRPRRPGARPQRRRRRPRAARLPVRRRGDALGATSGRGSARPSTRRPAESRPTVAAPRFTVNVVDTGAASGTGSWTSSLRAVGEAVANAVEHAGASSVVVFAETDDDGQVFCSVRDDGAGFDPAVDARPVTASPTPSIGRMAAIDGRAEVDSRPGIAAPRCASGRGRRAMTADADPGRAGRRPRPRALRPAGRARRAVRRGGRGRRRRGRRST